MLLLRLWNYLHGYVIIVVEGYFLEKFLNICAHRQILLWDVKRHKDSKITMEISINGFKLIRPIARKTKCRVRIIKKKGLPFIFNKYRKRKAFYAGAVLFVILIILMTSFIWSIEITGNKDLTTEYLEKALFTNGIRTGILKYGVNTDRVVTGMMLGIKELSWISIELKGTKVKVQLRERVPLPEMVARDVPCDIVAVRDGFIKQVIVTDGIESVNEGDTVQKGQVLISGRIPVKNVKDKFRLVHAMGSIKARTWYEEQYPVVLSKTEKIRTGREVNNYTLVLLNWKIGILNKKVTFNDYDMIELKKKLSIGEDLVFPFELVTEKYFENNLINARISEEDAKKAAVDAAYKKLMERIPPEAVIAKSDVRYVDDGNKALTAKVTIECLEEIGTTREIGGN